MFFYPFSDVFGTADIKHAVRAAGIFSLSACKAEFIDARFCGGIFLHRGCIKTAGRGESAPLSGITTAFSPPVKIGNAQLLTAESHLPPGNGKAVSLPQPVPDLYIIKRPLYFSRGKLLSFLIHQRPYGASVDLPACGKKESERFFPDGGDDNGLAAGKPRYPAGIDHRIRPVGGHYCQGKLRPAQGLQIKGIPRMKIIPLAYKKGA